MTRTNITRRATVRSLAKLNLDLRVLHKRADGFHELRTVFQTISLADTIAIEFEALSGRAARTAIEIDTVVNGEKLDIPDNLVVRAAHAALDALKVRARIKFRLEKKIPMGGGLGGGSSDAAAVLLALPVLAGGSRKKRLSLEKLMEMGAGLGSDVPFFLEGGTALAVDRGTEIYSLPDVAEEPILVVASGIHVATGPAYQALGRGAAGGIAGLGPQKGDRHPISPTPLAANQDIEAAKLVSVPFLRRASGNPDSKLTSFDLSRSINSFQCFVRALGVSRSARAASAFSANDFEPVVFGQHPQLNLLAARLRKHAGREAAGARMTGSGSALFAIFGSKTERDAAMESLKKDRVFGECRVMPASLVSRLGYQRMWRKQLAEHMVTGSVSGEVSGGSLWPPQSRHAT